MKKTIIAAAALVAMAGCNKTLIESPIADSDYGYINLGVSADTEMMVTKAGTAPAQEDLNKYNITISKDGSQIYSGEYSSIPDGGYKVTAGTYTVTAENLTIDEAYASDLNNGRGAMRVSGSNTVEVAAGQASTCPVECVPVNSKVSFVYTEQFANVFNMETARVTLEPDGRNLEMEMSADGAEITDAAYFEPATSIAWSLEAAAGSVAKNYTGSCKAVARKWTVVKFDAGENGVINVTITVNGDITEKEVVTETIDPLK